MPRSYAYVAPSCFCCCSRPWPFFSCSFCTCVRAGNSQIERTEITLASTQATRRLGSAWLLLLLLLHCAASSLVAACLALASIASTRTKEQIGIGSREQATGLFGRTRTRPLALGNLAGPRCNAVPQLPSPTTTAILASCSSQRAAAKV